MKVQRGAGPTCAATVAVKPGRWRGVHHDLGRRMRRLVLARTAHRPASGAVCKDEMGCPECGASIEVSGQGRLRVHGDRGDAQCRGSLLATGTWGGLGPVENGQFAIWRAATPATVRD